MRKRNEQLKIEHEKAVEIVVQGLKDRTKAEALVNSQSEQEETKFVKPVDQKELEKQKKLQKELLSLRRPESAIRDRPDERRFRQEDRPVEP